MHDDNHEAHDGQRSDDHVSRRRAFVPLLLSCSVGAQQPQPRDSNRRSPTFRTGTRLIVQTVTVKDKDGKPIEGLTAEGLHRHRGRRAAGHRFVEFQRLPGPTDRRRRRAGRRRRRRRRATRGRRRRSRRRRRRRSRSPPPGDIRYRTAGCWSSTSIRSAMPPPDQMRAYTNALKFIDTQMSPADLVAIMTFQDGAVR